MSRIPLSLVLYGLCASGIPLFSLFTVLVIDRGMTPFQVSALLATWSVAGFVFEVPSGALADRTSRKWIMAAAQAMCAIGFALWSLAPTFPGFLAGFFLWGAKDALLSGTVEAYYYDELASRGHEGRFTSSYASYNAIRSLAALLSSLAAVPLMRFGYEAVIWTSVGSCVLAALAAASLPEARRARIIGRGAYAKILGESFRLSLRDKGVLIATVSLAGTAVFFSMNGDLAPVLGRLSGVPPEDIGLLGSIGFAMLMLANLISKSALARLGPWTPWLFPPAAVGFLLATWTRALPGLALVALWTLALNIVWYYHNGKLQERVTSEIRATASSIAGLYQSVVQTLLTFGVGAVAGAWSYAVALIAFASIAFAFSLLQVLIQRFARP